MAATFHEYMRVFPGEGGKLTSRLKILETCKKLIETLPTLTNDPNKPEQVSSRQ